MCFYYRIIDVPQKVELIREGVHLGFQFHFGHVGCISVLHGKYNSDDKCSTDSYLCVTD